MQNNVPLVEGLPMKFYVQVDIEGVAGYTRHEDRLVGERAQLNHVYRMRRLLTAEVRAAVEALVEAGADEVVINDSHGSGDNLYFEDFPPAARVIHGPATRRPAFISCLDASFDAMVCIGQHAMAGTNGVLPHSRWDILCGDGKEVAVGEPGCAALVAGDLGVPCIMVSGDATMCRQMKELIPEIEAVAVKVPLSPYDAMTTVPKKAHQMIRDGIKKAVTRMGAIKPCQLSPPPFKTTIIAATPGFDKKSQVFEADTVLDLVHTALSTVYDYDLSNAEVWPLVPRGELILNKHERAYRARLEKEGKEYKPYIV